MLENHNTLVGNYVIMLKGTETITNNYLIKQLPKATAFLNKNLEIVYVSDKWVNDFEFDERNVVGKKINELFGKISKDWQKVLKDCLKGILSEVGTQSYIDNEDNEKWFEWINIPWYDEKENVIGVIIQTEDISQRVQTELKLEKLEILLKEKAEIVKIGSWEYNAEKKSLWWSDMTKKIHETPVDYIPDFDTALDFFKPGYSRNTASMLVFEATKKGAPWNEKLQIVTANGVEKWVIATGRPLYKNDKLIGLIGTFQDINEQITSEIKKKENEYLFKTLIDNLPINIYVKDKNLRKILVNKAECDYNGVNSPEELLGKTDFDFLSNTSAQIATDEELEVMDSLKPILAREGICTNKDGTKTNFICSKIPLLDENNEVGGIIGMSLDITETRNAQKELEEKERYFRSIFNSSYQFSGILDIDGTFLEINDTALTFADLQSEDIIGKKFWDAYWWPVPDFVKDGLKQTIKVAAKGKIMRSELIVFDKEKNQVPVDFTLKPIYDDSKKIVSLLAEGRMISEMVAARDKIKESEQKFRTLYELSPVSFMLSDFKTGKILDFNPSFSKTSGYDEESIAEINYWDLISNKSQNLKKQVTKKLESEGNFGPFEEKYIRKNGSEYPVIIHKSLIVNKKGEKLVWTIAQDISESEKKERQIREERKLLKTLIDNLPLNVYVKDTESRKILVNKSECDYLGVSNQKELLGKSDFDLYDKEIAQFSRDEDLYVLKSLKPILGRETVNVKKDGTTTTFLTSKIPLNGEDRKAIGILGISLDISHIKKHEEELRNLINVTSLQNKKLINFAHIVSHNLRSHTANFSMLLEFLVNEKDEIEKQNILRMLVDASENLMETLDNLNEVVAISANVNIEMKEINLHDKIISVEQNLSAFLKNSKAKIINTISKDTIIPVVPAYLESILMNFITNAVKYKSPLRDPIIKLSTISKNQYTILSIKDNGLGIDLDKHGDKMFGMYKTFHTNKDARGIGLYITKNQIEAMNGKVTLSSEVDKGTTFNIYFNERN